MSQSTNLVRNQSLIDTMIPLYIKANFHSQRNGGDFTAQLYVAMPAHY